MSTRAQQRDATRIAILEATVACLVEDGYSALTTRAIADRADIAQSTVMHHFETREALLVEAVTHLALRLVDRAQERIDLSALRAPEQREAVLDEAWREFSSPQALAAAQLWNAAWTEPELAVALRELEERIDAILRLTTSMLLPDQAGDPRVPALIDAAVALIRGLIAGVPIWGQDAVDERWEAIKPFVLQAVAAVLDTPEG